MGYIEQSLRSPFHEVRAMCHGMIIYRIFGELFIGFIKCNSIVYAYTYTRPYI